MCKRVPLLGERLQNGVTQLKAAGRGFDLERSCRIQNGSARRTWYAAGRQDQEPGMTQRAADPAVRRGGVSKSGDALDDFRPPTPESQRHVSHEKRFGQLKEGSTIFGG